MNTTTLTIRQFVARHGIVSRSEWADSNKNAPDWKDANHYKVTLTRIHHEDGESRGKTRQLTTYFSQGYAIQGAPAPADVLDCLASDAAGYENARSFEEWASEYGYDTDSRKAEKTYKLIGRQVEQLKQFLGEDLYTELLWHTERE